MTTDIAINGTIASVLPVDVHRVNETTSLPVDVHRVNETTSSVLPDHLYRVSSHFNDI